MGSKETERSMPASGWSIVRLTATLLSLGRGVGEGDGVGVIVGVGVTVGVLVGERTGQPEQELQERSVCVVVQSEKLE